MAIRHIHKVYIPMGISDYSTILHNCCSSFWIKIIMKCSYIIKSRKINQPAPTTLWGSTMPLTLVASEDMGDTGSKDIAVPSPASIPNFGAWYCPSSGHHPAHELLHSVLYLWSHLTQLWSWWYRGKQWWIGNMSNLRAKMCKLMRNVAPHQASRH